MQEKLRFSKSFVLSLQLSNALGRMSKINVKLIFFYNEMQLRTALSNRKFAFRLQQSERAQNSVFQFEIKSLLQEKNGKENVRERKI